MILANFGNHKIFHTFTLGYLEISLAHISKDALDREQKIKFGL